MRLEKVVMPVEIEIVSNMLYTIVESTNTQDLAAIVNTHMADGWFPHGNPFIYHLNEYGPTVSTNSTYTSVMFCQALIRTEES